MMSDFEELWSFNIWFDDNFWLYYESMMNSLIKNMIYDENSDLMWVEFEIRLIVMILIIKRTMDVLEDVVCDHN